MRNELVSWSHSNPTQFNHEEAFSRVDYKDYGANLIVPINGVAYKVHGGARAFYCYQSLPGLIPMYYMIQGDTIHCSQSLFSMRAKAKEIGLKIKDIMQCKEGVAYHFSAKGLRRYVVDKLEYSLNTTLSLPKAADRLLELLVAAANHFKGRKVLTPISGGTDGILTAYALKLAGVDQHCVCVGRTPEDFDPKFAAIYAEKLGLSYELMTLPEDDEGLSSLLERGLASIEMADFSNVLMGMCNVLIAEKAKAEGYGVVMNADLADVVLGNDIFTQGSFKKKNENPTAKKWADERIDSQLRTLPTNLQIYKAHQFNGVPVSQLFADRAVLQHLLGLSFECTPLDGTKPLYYNILDRVLPENSWVGGKKVGYYTGSGIGKIRLENPILKDENIRSVFAKLCP